MTNDPQKWYFKWWSVILSLILIGPFGFPLLWKSKDFNLFWKICLTLSVTALTVVMVWATWATVEVTIQKFKEAGLI